MRAVYLENELINDQVKIIDKVKIHHLLNVVRLKINEKVIILNNSGNKFHSLVVKITKQEIVLNIDSKETCEPYPIKHIAICVSKKEYFEQSVRLAIEIGIQNIIPVISQFSQTDVINPDRLSTIITNAIEQSNNPFGVQIEDEIALLELANKNYRHFVFITEEKRMKKNFSIKSDEEIIFWIGPEGGFSREEIEVFSKNCVLINIPAPIMKATTAISVCAGYILGKMN